MRAMIFAAGLGTRLQPLTDNRPKALVTLGERTLLEITLEQLRKFGVSEAIVNAHHFADQVVDFLSSNRTFGMRIEVSREEDLLDTGGGLKKAAWFFRESDEPFIVHNVDVLSTIDLAQMVEFHRERNALATLAVQQRTTSRPLLFDNKNQFHGRGAKSGSPQETSSQSLQSLAFCGIHIISPRIFAKLDEIGAFSIIDAYVRLAAQGESILGFRTDGTYWRDLGRPEHLAEAERDLADGTFRIE